GSGATGIFDAAGTELAATGVGAETLGASGTESGGIKGFTAEGTGMAAGLAGISAGIGRKAGVFSAVSASFRRLSASAFAGTVSGFFSVSSVKKIHFSP